MALEPIVHEYDLRCTPAEAFDVYVKRIAEWWHPAYTANPDTLEGVAVDPGVGSRVYETHKGGRTIDWGRVTIWEPGRRLAYTSTLGQTREHPSEVTVRFTPNGTGCRLRFEHGGWNEGNASDRRKFSDWSVMLDRFAALANGAATP